MHTVGPLRGHYSQTRLPFDWRSTTCEQLTRDELLLLWPWPWPMTLMFELDVDIPKTYQHNKKTQLLCQGFKNLNGTDTHRHVQLNISPCCIRRWKWSKGTKNYDVHKMANTDNQTASFKLQYTFIALTTYIKLEVKTRDHASSQLP